MLAALCGLSIGFTTNAGATGSEPGTKAAKDVDVISREVLFGNPERASFQASPDGKFVSWLAPKDGVLNVYVAPIDHIEADDAVTNDDYRGIRQYFWAENGTHIIYMQDKGGDENFHAFSVNLKTGERIELTPFEGARAQIQQTSKLFPNHILIGVNNRDPQLFDIYKVDVTTGERELVFENSGYLGFNTDDHFNVRFAARYEADGSVSYFEVDGDTVKDEIYLNVPSADALTTQIVGFNTEGDKLYIIDSRTGNTAALFVRDMNTGQTDMLYEHPKADISGAMGNPKTGEVEAVAANYLRTEWKILDDAVAGDLKYLRTVQDGDISITSRVKDDTLWTVAYVHDDGPVEYYTYDRTAKQAEYIFSNRPELENKPLAKMHPTVIESRDGLNLVSYLTLPVWTDTDGDARPEEALPMVLLVHGGPWARDQWGYNSMHQWLSNRGYAVLSVNYRGSTGFGKDFINASNFEWAGKMHDDLIDAVNWAEAEGIADPDRVAIMGGSYGGYATLVGLTFTPDTFACGVDIVGPSSLVTLLNSIPPYWKPAMELFNQRVGNLSTEEGRELLESRSPLNFIEKIKKPLLIAQGANDPRVKQSEADQIVHAMTEKNIPVTYILFPDEGHGFARPENSMAFNAAAEAFLAEHIGGRYEPIDDDIEGSTMQVPTGADEVPGLKDALGDK
ncbi:MAG: S9 family peptidase [Phycisphaera sp.]|nr:S9 family peptidase [Phycisphaera sp.]